MKSRREQFAEIMDLVEENIGQNSEECDQFLEFVRVMGNEYSQVVLEERKIVNKKIVKAKKHFGMN